MHIACWPFREVEQILARRKKLKKEHKPVIFETGYGPSGLPHIGTFGEVFRTTMVKQAFEYLTQEKAKLYIFSDDMDGLRKVPTNIPNQELLYTHLNKPLTAVPDPFEKYSSFAQHNNAMLCKFLDDFNFQYEFKSSTETYKSGVFNEVIIRILEKYDDIMNVMLPSLRQERQKTYSPFLPICPSTGQVLQVPTLERNLHDHTIIYLNTNGSKSKTSVLNGCCKLQWKVDWAMRWVALNIDYEMNGKDLVDSVTLSQQISQILGYNPPNSLTYELFLDEAGYKISKSKGNGITIDNWLQYGNKESLSFYMFQSPTKAKKLHYQVIPQATSEYLNHLEKYPVQTQQQQLENPVWHIHNGKPPSIGLYPISFNMIVNLANIFNTDQEEIVWQCLQRYNPNIKPKLSLKFDEMVTKAVKYYYEIIKGNKIHRQPDSKEKLAIKELITKLEAAHALNGEEIQTLIYEIGNKHSFCPLKNWFKCLYELILGQNSGPRLGTLITIYGLNKTITLLKNIIK